MLSELSELSENTCSATRNIFWHTDYTFIKAVATINPIFAANREDKFIKLKEQNNLKSLLFKKFIYKFYNIKRI
jgi:hypothetical protein